MKIGDTVRYLNAVGGGRVVRIDGDMAYVDDEGFETPVLVRECVVISHASALDNVAVPKPQAPKATSPKADTPAPTRLPVIETKGGDILNLVLGFEPENIKALSQTTFDAYLVNDSNYYVYACVISRATDDDNWTLRYDGLIEPNIQEFLFELTAADLAHFDRVEVQYLAFKRERDFEAKAPGRVELKIDTTKFVRLHCFRPNTYFDTPVIAYDVAVADRAATQPVYKAEDIARGMAQKERDTRRQTNAEHKAAHLPSSKPDNGAIEVDLHASAMFETTEGLSPADILNFQIDRFTEVMNANLRRPGTRIIFIHGKGEGVLRQAIMKELTHRFKGHDVQDASFREYGFGATQVTIKAVDRQQQSKPAKNKRR